MPRSLTVVNVDLDEDRTTEPFRKLVTGRALFVAHVPVWAIGVVLLSVDGAQAMPIYPGYTARVCLPDAPAIQELALYAPAVGGTVSLVMNNDDLQLSGGGAGAGDTVPFFEALWAPHRGVGTGSGTPAAWMLRGASEQGVASTAFWADVVAGLGLVPQVDRKGNQRVVLLRPNGGTSGLRFLLTEPSWQRLRTDAGRSVTGAPDASGAVYRFSVEVGKEAAGGANSNSGLYCLPSNGTLVGGPTPNAHFGVYDVAGALRFRARATNGGPLTIDEAITLASETDFTRLTLEMLDADPAANRDGEVRLYVNRQMVKRYANMGLFPATSAGPATATGYQFVLADEGASANAHFVRRARYQQGALGMAPV